MAPHAGRDKPQHLTARLTAPPGAEPGSSTRAFSRCSAPVRIGVGIVSGVVGLALNVVGGV